MSVSLKFKCINKNNLNYFSSSLTICRTLYQAFTRPTNTNVFLFVPSLHPKRKREATTCVCRLAFTLNYITYSCPENLNFSVLNYSWKVFSGSYFFSRIYLKKINPMNHENQHNKTKVRITSLITVLNKKLFLN